MQVDISALDVKPGGVIIVVAPQDRWGAICEAFQAMETREEFRGTPVLMLEPGEKISSLAPEELALAGLKRI